MPTAFQAWAALPMQATLILDTRVAPFNRAAVREPLDEVATPGVAAREALASAGLPDAFDVRVWNTQELAVAEPLVAAEFASLAANAALVSSPDRRCHPGVGGRSRAGGGTDVDG